MYTRSVSKVILLILFYSSYGKVLKPRKPHKGKEQCEKLLFKPSFEPELLLECQWSICYTWVSDYRNHCYQVKFDNSTPEVTKRIWSDMEEYLDQHPPWEAALLNMKSSVPEEILLFTDQGQAGKLTAINNVVRSNQLVPGRKTIPLSHFAFKFLMNGKYLAKLNCDTGAAELMVRNTIVPDTKEIEEVVKTLPFLEGGRHACTKKYWAPLNGAIEV